MNYIIVLDINVEDVLRLESVKKRNKREVIPLNEENLIPFNQMTEEQQREIARKGGIASAEARKRRKTLKEELIALLEMNDNNNKISLAILQKALNGDIQAFTTIRDTIGEKPKEEIEVSDVTNKKFDEICSQIGGDGLDE